ncbi:hypothetical protein AK829_06950 [Corynebacterium riegelii]|uniref:Beta-N-acetylglucosaminidase n=2 Tax=Corynebacterium riegelii TaxID=156976 RepID=A0A0K1RC21_9CORY|nr:hypothetical protein AK829_06950 [Corynebacterium riegelii]
MSRNMRTVLKRHLTIPATAAAVALTLSACGNDAEDPEPASSTTSAASSSASTTTTAPTTTSPTESATSSATTSATASASASASSSTSKSTATSATSTAKEENSTLDEVAEHFATLAPASFFAQLDECTEGGFDGAYNCSGREIGQFQFFDSESKAASTTQLLTQLRSSRVVEDENDRIVGWSVLANSAIITVVDNNTGQVMQQLISTDDVDPRTRIYELGLAQQTGEVSTPGTTTATKSAEAETEAEAEETASN